MGGGALYGQVRVHASAWRLFLPVFLMAGFFAAGDGLPHAAYVWQRAWTMPVRHAVAERGQVFARVVVLRAEVTWQGNQPRVAHVPVHYPALVETKRPVGLALRIGPHAGSLNRTGPEISFLADLSQKLVEEARKGGVPPSELQLDFDCASLKLEGYRAWVEVIRTRVAPVPVVITALPDWLEQPDFERLVRAADGYVLQVHSLERPRSFEAPFTLCDPNAARRAVAKASALGVPFRVALPTYGYIMAFDNAVRFIGLSAEGPAKGWPSGSRTREGRADPLQIAGLVQEWSSSTPPALKGLLWYRLPVPGETLNWRWPTLNAILQARIPRKSVRVEAHRVEAGLAEVRLVNDGELDISSRLAVKARWSGVRLMAGDGLHGFEMADRGVSSAKFETGARAYRLAAGEQQAIGWLRLGADCEVQVEIEELDGR
jgi:hypothetical protein